MNTNLDPVTQREPTTKQMELILALNPVEEKVFYEDAAEKLGITIKALEGRLRTLKKRCPTIYERFMAFREQYDGRPMVQTSGELDLLGYDQVKETF